MSPSSATSSFTGRRLCCERGGRRVFDKLDFTLADGGAVLLLGPNGSGKSSLLRLMAGLLKARSGVLAWNDQPVADEREAHAQRVAYVGHLDAVKPALSSRENLLFWARLKNADDAEARVEAGLAAFALTALSSTPAKYLSAGQKRRLGLARLVAAPSSLWLLDEPTVALDTASVGALEKLIAEHREKGGLVALSTHAGLALDGATTLRLDQFAPLPVDPAELWL